MITISKKTEYSLFFLSFLEKNKGKEISLTDAARMMGLPYRFLGQLAVSLKDSKIVESKEGKSGGYKLNDSRWNEVTMYDLLVALGEDKHMVQCLDENNKCLMQEKCHVHKIWGELEKTMIEELKKIKLHDL